MAEYHGGPRGSNSRRPRRPMMTQDAIRKSYEAKYHNYKKYVAALNNRQQPFKSLGDHERFIKLMNATISHPEKMLMNLPKAREGELQIYGCFYLRTNVLKEGFHYYGGNVQPGMFTDASFFGLRNRSPSRPLSSPGSPPPTCQNRRIHDRSYLSEAIINAEVAIGRFVNISTFLHQFACRFEHRGPFLRFYNRYSGLPQLAGFCERICKSSEPCKVGADVLCEASYLGLSIASEFLQDQKVLFRQIKGEDVPFLYTGPNHEDCLAAQDKIQIGRDHVFGTYQVLGRGGFRGGWSNTKVQNPDIMSAEELESCTLELLKGVYSFATWCESCIAVFRVLIHPDITEKSYLLAHFKTMRIQDQIDAILRIDELFRINQKLHEVITEMNERAVGLYKSLQYYEEECIKVRRAEEAEDRARALEESASSRTSSGTSEPEIFYEPDLHPVTLALLEQVVDDHMEKYHDYYYNQPPTFPLDPPRR